MKSTNNKRARFDVLSPVVVSSDEVRNIQHRDGGYIGRLVQWLQSKGVIGKYKNDETGWDNIAVNRASVKGVVFHGAKDGKIALLEVTPDLIRNGIYLETNPENKEGLISHIFTSKAVIDGVLYAIGYVVREDKNGRRYYDHELTHIKEIDHLDINAGRNSIGTPQQTGPSANPAGKESVINILKKHLAVNT
jgi:hypothetical protein